MIFIKLYHCVHFSAFFCSLLNVFLKLSVNENLFIYNLWFYLKKTVINITLREASGNTVVRPTLASKQFYNVQ